MKTEKAGCILLDREHKKVALVYREDLNDYSFPKGHLEEGESLLECAIRETAEETKRDCKLLKEEPIATDSYQTPSGEDVIVYYYLVEDIGKSDNQSLDTHPTIWVPLSEVHDKLSYSNLQVMYNSIRDEIEE